MIWVVKNKKRKALSMHFLPPAPSDYKTFEDKNQDVYSIAPSVLCMK